MTLGLLAAAALPASASAAEQVGSTAGFAGFCSPNMTYVQNGVVGAPDYVADAPGVVTSWSMRADDPADSERRFMVLRRDTMIGPANFTATQKDIVRTISGTNVNVITGLHLPINAGETIGVYITAAQPMGDGNCLEFTGQFNDTFRQLAGEAPLGTTSVFSATMSDVRINLAATVEPDADGDRFGDETQDKCPTLASVQTTCPAPAATPPATKKKCKRKRKKRSAAAAKKKRCKKKRKK